MKFLNTNKYNLSLLVLAFVLTVVMPVLHAFGVISDFRIGVWGKYLCYAILAISVDLLWGYTGLLSLGQALFFSLGGYLFGMHLMLMIGTQGQGGGVVPDFMGFLGRTTVPSWWQPFYSFPFATIMVVLLPALVAYIFGYLAFRSRIKGVYFSILTQALTYAAMLIFNSNESLMGGTNGFTDFRTVIGENLRTPESKRVLYICTAVLLCAVFFACRWLTTTKFGLIQRAIRDSEGRVLFSGYASANFKLFVFVACAIIASLGGALFVPQAGIINPTEMATDKSLEAVVWVAVGGRGTLFGPVIGAVAVNMLKSWATRAYPDYWLIILGGAFVLIVLFMPKGLMGLPAQLASLWRHYLHPFIRRTPRVPADASLAKSNSAAP